MLLNVDNAGAERMSCGRLFHMTKPATLSRMNLCEIAYVGHVTIFSSVCTSACCLVVVLGL